MRNFKKFTSPVIPLPQKDIDTDLIIPAEFLKTTHREGLGKHVFENIKNLDPSFPKIEGQRILVVGKNFGCGSSREHAPWALKDAEIDVIISSEFADIFRGNAEKNGILPIVLPEDTVQKFISSKKELSVDLENQKIYDSQNGEYWFEISHFAKQRLLHDLSDLDYLIKLLPKIQKFACYF